VVGSDNETKGPPMTSPTVTEPRLGEAMPATPTGRLLSGALLVAPLIYLAADSTYAVRGWHDATAGVIHVLGAISYGFVVLRVATWLPQSSKLAAAILLTGLIGLAGNVAYGFEAIHQSLGDTALVHQPGAANLIKPLGLFFPLSFALIAVALARLGHRWQAALVLVAMVGWPIAHIGNIAAIAVPVNIALVVAFGSLAWTRAQSTSPLGLG
jgi:hypothetical protein